MPSYSEIDIVAILRPLCQRLAGSFETISHGHPAFATARGLYAVIEDYRGDLSICVKVGAERQAVLLNDSRYYRTPYIGNRGWVSLKVHAAPLNEAEIGDLLTLSHRLTAPGRPAG